MNIIDIIYKKRNNEVLTKEEIEYVVNSYVANEIADYQVSALLMAICINGLNDKEIYDLTLAMMNSGDKMDLSSISNMTIDKHSTGGVGDKTTLVLAPMLASMGFAVAKMSGRGLGHTGGTIDKLESIEGFKVELSEDRFISNINKINFALASQTKNIAPADKKIYALRDVTATVDNIGLIASSVMSKKLACGARTIVLDVKVGNGSFMTEVEEAKKLANCMIDIGKKFGRNICAVISDMNQPLGHAVGNALELKEAISVLRGEEKGELLELCLELGAYALTISGQCSETKDAKKSLLECVSSGKAYEKFIEFVRLQDGNIDMIKNTELLPKSEYEANLLASETGFITSINSKEVGMSALISGAGRLRKEDKIDFGAGIYLHKKLGDSVNKGDIVASIYSSSEEKLNQAKDRLAQAIIIGDRLGENSPLIYEVVL